MAGDLEHPRRESIEDYSTTWSRPSVFYNRTTKWVVYTLIVLFVLWSFQGVNFDLARFIKGIGPFVEVLSQAWPPDFGPRQRDLIIEGLYESVGIAFLASTLGVLVSIPFSLLAAENIAPKPIYYPARLIVVLSRTFHPLILGILFVKAVGVGAFAGILTFVTGTVGYWAKLMAEDIEDMDEGQVNAVRAVGANRIQTVIYGIVPQVVPRAVGITIYRWDSNLRGSVIIGLVGAGGIGLTLVNSYDRYDYDFTLAILIAIVVLVLAGEAVSALIRRRVY